MKVKRFILQWIWLLPLLIWFALTVHAKLSDETLQIVDDLRRKHNLYSITGDVLYSNFDYEWWSFYFEDGKLFIETQDGKWFVEMKEVRKDESDG